MLSVKYSIQALCVCMHFKKATLKLRYLYSSNTYILGKASSQQEVISKVFGIKNYTQIFNCVGRMKRRLAP